MTTSATLRVWLGLNRLEPVPFISPAEAAVPAYSAYHAEAGTSVKEAAWPGSGSGSGSGVGSGADAPAGWAVTPLPSRV